jgi:2',3'-cyclic-nucleotide 2'-phosphodiesterase (5'-nucleotidase family)
LDLLFARDASGRWRVSRYRAGLIPVTADIPEDPQVAAVVERYWRPVAACYGEVVGEAAFDFVGRGHDQAEHNLMADAMRAALGSEVHLENQGGVRAPLAKGPVTWADLVALDPFDDTLVTFQISGRRLLEVLAAHAPAVSGVRYRMEGGRVTEATVGGPALDPAREYSASTNSYFARKALGGVGGLAYRDTGIGRRQTLVEYVRARRVIHPLYDGRRVIVDLDGR